MLNQPNLAETESAAWLAVLLAGLGFLLLLLAFSLLYYRHRRCGPEYH